MGVSPWLRAQGGLGVALFALFLAVALPQAVSRALRMLDLEQEVKRETSTELRARFSGPAYVSAIDKIRQALPLDEPYLLVEGGRRQDGDLYWLRFDLAPRRPMYLGQLSELTNARQVRARLPANVRLVIVAFGPGEPPRLYERYQFVAEIERRAAGEAPDAAAPPGDAGQPAPLTPSFALPSH